MNAKPMRNAAMRRLWERMAAIYGHRWTSSYGERCEDDSGALTIPGDTWARGLAGMPEISIGTGLNGCLKSADGWPPSLPEFRMLCFDVPPLARVKHDLAKKEVSRFVRQVWFYIDRHRFARVDQRENDKMLADAYYLASEHVMSGGELPEEPIAAIEQHKEPKRNPAPPEVANKAFADMAAILGEENPA